MEKSNFKSEIKMFLIVAIVAVILAVVGILLGLLVGSILKDGVRIIFSSETTIVQAEQIVRAYFLDMEIPGGRDQWLTKAWITVSDRETAKRIETTFKERDDVHKASFEEDEGLQESGHGKFSILIHFVDGVNEEEVELILKNTLVTLAVGNADIVSSTVIPWERIAWVDGIFMFPGTNTFWCWILSRNENVVKCWTPILE